MATIDWDALVLELRGELLDGLKPFVEGTEEDLKTFGSLIALDMVRAVREVRRDLISELEHQLEALAEVHRIRAVNATWEQIGKFIAFAGRIALRAVAAVAV